MAAALPHCLEVCGCEARPGIGEPGWSSGRRTGVLFTYLALRVQAHSGRSLGSVAESAQMAYEIVPEPGEQVEARIALALSKKAQPFYLAVTNRALYLPRIKLIAKSDPYYFQRVRLEQVEQVTVRRLAPYALWILAGLMVCGGLVTTLLMLEPLMTGAPGSHEVSGWPIAVFVCGFLVPFAARGRFGLEIRFSGGSFRWKPPLVVDRASREKIAAAFQTIVEACEKCGVRVFDKRAG